MVETVFENRFQHLEEMRRMGLHSEIIRDTARIVGGQPLQGAEVLSTDLRASAALILTGLVAQGKLWLVNWFTWIEVTTVSMRSWHS